MTPTEENAQEITEEPKVETPVEEKVKKERSEGYVPERPALPESVKIETDECFDEEDEETKTKGLFEDVTDYKGDEKFRPFVTKKQLVRKLEENGIHLSTNRLTRHMKGWGYPVDDRNRKGDRGWHDINLVVANMEFTQDH